MTKSKTEQREKIIFDADRDNNSKGISPDEMIKMLKKIKRPLFHAGVTQG